MADDAEASRWVLASALRYTARGLRVLPVRPRQKAPAIKRWQEQATADQDQLFKSWGQWPAANIGIATGREADLFVLDVDQHGVDGEGSLAALEARHGALPETPVQRTGGGGRQLFFLWPEGRDVRNSAGKLAPGLDVRGEGGYVVAPPSIHPSGERCRWERRARLAAAPPWLLDLLMVYPDLPRGWRNVDRCPNEAARQAVAKMYRRLAAVEPAMVGADCTGAIPFLRFQDDAQEAFDQWREGLECRLRSGDLSPLMEAHLAKYRSLVPSLALLCHLADLGQGPVGSPGIRELTPLP